MDFNELVEAEVNKRVAAKLREIADSLSSGAKPALEAAAVKEAKKAQPGQRGAAGRICGRPGCGKKLHALSKKNWCKACLADQPAQPRQLCKICQKPLRSDNHSGYCKAHRNELRKEQPEAQSALPVSA